MGSLEVTQLAPAAPGAAKRPVPIEAAFSLGAGLR